MGGKLLRETLTAEKMRERQKVDVSAEIAEIDKKLQEYDGDRHYITVTMYSLISKVMSPGLVPGQVNSMIEGIDRILEKRGFKAEWESGHAYLAITVSW